MLSYNCMNKEERRKHYQKHRNEYLKLVKATVPGVIKSFEETDKLIMQLDEELGVPEDKRYKPTIFTETDLIKDYMNYYDNHYQEEMYNDAPNIFNVDITSVLNDIKNSPYEKSVMIAIKNGKIVDAIYKDGTLPLECKFTPEEYSNFYAKHSDCKLILVHNHPVVISAKPSEQDYKCMQTLYDNYNFSSFCVVTKLDFYKNIK